MEWWAYLAAAISVCIILRYTVFRAFLGPVEVLEEESVDSRLARRERELRTLNEIAHNKKLNISLDLLEFERKKARAERVEKTYASLVADIKGLNVRGRRRLDAGHPCESKRPYHFFLIDTRPYTVPLDDSELAEIAESNALGEQVAELLRRNGLGVDTSGKMSYGEGNMYRRERLQNRMIISW